MVRKTPKTPPQVRETISGERVERAIDDVIAYLIQNFDWAAGRVALVGVQTRGAILAQRFAARLSAKIGRAVPVGAVDITLYRDDFGTSGIQPVIGETHINFEIDGKEIVLIDDVLFTGRTVRAAVDELMDYGRPKRIVLVVLIDRGHRELPIAADFAPLTVSTKRAESVNLRLKEIDGEEDIVIYDPA